MNVDESKIFTNTDSIQTYTIETSGIYKLEVWGAAGGDAKNSEKTYTGGCGGYAKGYKKLTKGTVIYIGVGGIGTSINTNPGPRAGGFNGGGSGYEVWVTTSAWVRQRRAGGGGACHIALVDGTLPDIGESTFTTKGLIVAGGGGGAQAYSDGHGSNWGSNGGDSGTGGYNFGQGQNTTAPADNWNFSGGGGGGYSGGTSGCGGTNSVANTPSFTHSGVTYEPSTSNGVNTGYGTAKITLMKKIGLKLGDIDLSEVKLGDVDINAIYLGDTEL